MGEWLIAETTLFGVAIQNWLLVAAGAFVFYGLGLSLWRRRAQGSQ